MVRDADGANQRVLKENGPVLGQVSFGKPSWSPDGARLVVLAGFPLAGRATIVVAVADGSEQTLVTLGQATAIAWKP
jgi:hypothetical protein